VAAALVGAAALGGAAFWLLTAPRPLEPGAVPRHEPDAANGEVLFHAGSCLTCHAPADDAEQTRPSLPSGGRPFSTPVGTLYPQNLTPDLETGIGGWSERDFVDAMWRGLSPHGQHYFPAFPYPSYRFMTVEDVLDLRAYLMTLPPVRSPRHDAGVPLASVARRGVGLWNRLALREGASDDPAAVPSAAWKRGRYLVRGVGHCGECHTPRDWLMIPDESRYLAGGPHPRGEGDVPSLRGLVRRGRYKDAADLTFALQYGETYGYDKLSSGGMGDIQENLARLPEADLRAISQYLVSLD
jgi:mono/diheme cytochrome c family protein